DRPGPVLSQPNRAQVFLEKKDHPHLGAVLLVVPEVDDLAEWRGVQALDHGRVVRPAEPPGGPCDALEQRREVQLRRRGTGLLRLRATRLRARAGMGLRQHLQEWTQLTQALHSLLEKPFGFDPVVEVVLHRPPLARPRTAAGGPRRARKASYSTMCPISIHPIHLFAVSGRKCYDAPVSLKHPSTVDHTLLARVAKGDQEAFERLYEQTSSLLYT